MAFCVNCGNELREGANYCPKCGAAIGNISRSIGTSSKNYVKWIGALALLAVLCVGGYFGFNALSGDSPSDVAVKAWNCLKDNDFKGFCAYKYSPKNLTMEQKKEKIESASNSDEFKQIEQGFLNSAGFWGGIKDVSKVSEDISGDVATVKIQVTYEKGMQQFVDVKLRKQENGLWGIENINQ